MDVMMTNAPRTLLLYSAPKHAAGDPWMTFLPIGLGYLQAMLKARGFACRIANISGLSRKQVLTYVREQKPDVVGVSMFTFNRRRSMDLLGWVRESAPEALLLAGGPHPTHVAREVFEDCPALDAIVKGEGELPLLGVVTRLATGEPWREAPGLVGRDFETESPSPIEDLDGIGLPLVHHEADFFHDPQQHGYLSTSRGCPAKCTFCNTPEFWGSSMRFRSAASVLEELRLLRLKHGLTYFSFRDDTFTARPSRILDLMAGMQASELPWLWNCQSRVNLIDEERLVAMKRAGCEFMQFGVEHASPRMLVQLDKGIRTEQIHDALALVRKVGIQPGIYLITGIPGETWADVEESARLIREARPHDVQVSPLALYPGTRLWDQALKEGRISRDFFRSVGDDEVFARVDAHTEKALRHLERLAQAAKERPVFSPAEFRAQKAWLGFCAVTNLLCGEAAELEGRWNEAEGEYAEVIQREPGNTWGFLKRAVLFQHTNRLREARADLKEVLRLAPGNPEAKGLLDEMGRRN